MDKLKPCPFCGGTATVLKIDNVWYEVHCDSCPCNLGRCWFTNRKDAIEAWNRRADTKEIDFDYEAEDGQ